MGILGFNGAGKSTLLKILAGIYKPTSGTIKTYGKIAPLLELGAGFDKNYTGENNIYLNGAFLSMTKDFIDSKYDEIVEFSELGEYIKYPVKNYSSGMRAKLGFSIATLVEPDILIVDEILSVGDIKFRKKSSEKIQEMMHEGVAQTCTVGQRSHIAVLVTPLVHCKHITVTAADIVTVNHLGNRLVGAGPLVGADHGEGSIVDVRHQNTIEHILDHVQSGIDNHLYRVAVFIGVLHILPFDIVDPFKFFQRQVAVGQPGSRLEAEFVIQSHIHSSKHANFIGFLVLSYLRAIFLSIRSCRMCIRFCKVFIRNKCKISHSAVSYPWR